MKRFLLIFFAAIVCATSTWAAPAVAVDGKLPGAFSVSDTKVVYFSQGNLRAITTNLGTNWTWSFAENQYDYIGNAAANNAVNGNGSVSSNGSVDLFGWSTAATIYGIHNSTVGDSYTGVFVDWGTKAITNGGNTANAWRTLTKDEWGYLFNTRTTTSGIRYAKSTVNGFSGIILLPNNWNASYYALSNTNIANAAYTSNVITSTDWVSSLEAHGAVFLPAAGRRSGTTLDNIGVVGGYWSATSGGSTYAYQLDYGTGFNVPAGIDGRALGLSVRLVSEVAPPTMIETPLTFEAMEAGATVTYTLSSTKPIEYSTDGTTWTDYSDAITLANVGDKVSFRGSNINYYGGSIAKFNCSKDCYIYGNIMSLVNTTDYATATTLPGPSVFSALFKNNTHIKNHPTKDLVLPATTLTYACYAYMFQDCTGLTRAPELPATTLTSTCYCYMFAGCTGLTKAPALPATTLDQGDCYSFMFEGCTNLSSVTCLATTKTKSTATLEWLNGVASTGTFYAPADGYFNNQARGISSIPEGWTINTNLFEPLTLEAAEDGDGGITFNLDPGVHDIFVRIDNTPEDMWMKINGDGVSLVLTDAGRKVYIRGDNTTLNGVHITCGKDYYIYGNIMSLIDADNYATNTTLSTENTFHELFKNNSHIINHPTKELVLPATTLTAYCYSSMFWGCDGLTRAPELPATNLASHCYDNMFYGCDNLASVPILPATTLAENCYGCMFQSCAGLTTLPENMLPATTLANSCYIHMFAQCPNLTSAPNLPATTLVNQCYFGMFKECPNLINAPELPAATLAPQCYWFMFNGCTNLSSVTCDATIPASLATYYWLDGVAATGTFYAPANGCFNNQARGVSSIPEGWTIVLTSLIGAGTEADPYIISSTEEWNYLANQVAAGTDYTGKFFRQTENISVTTMVGTGIDESIEHPFSGTYDGDGHTLTVTYDSSNKYAAPFSHVNGSTFKNLHVTGTITTSAKYAAGFIGHSYSANTFINCRSSVIITSTLLGDGTHGGFVGILDQDGSSTTSFEGCVFDGKLIGDDTKCWGGFVGWSNTQIHLINCLFIPEEVEIWNDDCQTFSRAGNLSTLFAINTNNYYSQLVGGAQAKKMCSITSDNGVTVANAGTETVYNVSGITSYGTGIKYNDVLYGGEGDEVSLTLNDSPTSYYSASKGSLWGNSNPYTLLMSAANTVISPAYGYLPVCASVTEDAGSAYVPAAIVNGDFGTQPNPPAGVDEGWNTTDTEIEWTNTLYYYNLTASEDRLPCIELAASNRAVLSQDLTTHGNELIRWSLSHTVRTNCGISPQSLSVLIGAPERDGENAIVVPSGVNEEVNAHIIPSTQAVYSSTGVTGYNGYGDESLQYLSLNKSTQRQWYTAGGVYSVPANQTVTRLAIIDDNNTGCGNMLDDVTFSTLVGNLSAERSGNGDVTIKGYWGESNMSKKMVLEIGSETYNVNMAGLAQRNFIISIPNSCLSEYYTTLSAYHEDYMEAKITVDVINTTPASLTTAPTAVDNLVYNGSEQALLNNDGVAAGGTLNYSLNNADWSEDIPTATNAGSYTVYYMVVGDAYHADFIPSLNTIEVTIADFSGAGTESDPYLIPSTVVWNHLADKVNAGNTYAGKSFRQTADISVTTMIGAGAWENPENPFSGTYDGDGHVLTFTISSSEHYIAPFRFVNGAHFKNLIIDGTNTSTGIYNAGLVGFSIGDVTITNCAVRATLTNNATSTPFGYGNSSCGGFYGRLHAGSVAFNGCLFAGQIVGSANCEGGFVGWASDPTGVDFTDCLFAPTALAGNQSGTNTFYRGPDNVLTFTNSYYLTSFGTAQAKQAYTITAGAGVTVANAGTETIYNVSGITSYGTGIQYNGVLYGGNGDAISLTLSGAAQYGASAGTLTGDNNPYSLTMATSNTIILACASVTLAPTAITGLEYDGNAHALINAGTAEGGTMKYSMDNSIWSTEIPTATAVGDYTVYYMVEGDADHMNYKPVDNTIAVSISSPSAIVLTANPDPDPQHAGDYYSTFYHSAVAYELSAGVEAYVAELSADALILTKIAEGGEVIPMDNAVILKSNSGAITLTPSDATPVNFEATNNLHGVDEPTASPANCYVLSGHSSDNSVTGVGFYQYTGMLKAHKAYAVIDAGIAYAPKKLRFVFNQEQTTTDVDQITNDQSPMTNKVIKDGVLYIEKNGVRYNAQGQIIK